MIYLFYGENTEEKKESIKEKARDTSVIRLQSTNLNKEMLLNYGEQKSLFGEVFTILIENPISEAGDIFDDELLSSLKESNYLFIFLEDKLSLEDIKKYKKYIKEISKFEIKSNTKFIKKENPFTIVNLFENKDKINTWIEYRKIVEKGGELEPVLGMFFWKIKSMILSKNSKFTENELKNQSKELVDIYHKSHLGILDMDIAIEQFILKNL